jgi:two-component system, NarL family, sensor histidine kinase UhpB
MQEMEVLSMVAKETNNSVIIFDKVTRNTLWVNEGFTRLTGFKEKDIVGKNPVALLTGAKTDKTVLKYMSKQIENDLSYFGDLLVYAKDGSKRLHQVIGQPIKNANGPVTKYFAIGTDITEQRRMEEERLQKEVEQQKEITRVTLQTQESERNELGRELHDNVNQILGAVKLQLSYCLSNYDAAVPIIKKSIQYVHEAIEEIRNLSHRMVMPRFSEHTLPYELKKLTANYTCAQIIQLETAEWADENISTAVKETFFRIAQEQLANINKHAQAGKITIQLNSNQEHAEMIIEDNGIGFDTSQKKKGIGITNIFNRVESYNGNSHLTSAPGKGCILSVCVPLNGI